mmetsp:Transcript_20484/g.42837  ORF Transcript_20484/g.42837 Transcript_20484/m.42837 type:complete len:494 (+) Transcript_20484:661-2142(+)
MHLPQLVKLGNLVGNETRKHIILRPQKHQVLQIPQFRRQIPGKEIIKQMKTLHALPAIDLRREDFALQSPVQIAVDVSSGEPGVDGLSVGAVALIEVVVLHGHVEQLEFGGIVEFVGYEARETVAVKFEREEVGHGSEFGGDRSVEAVTVHGEVLEETQLGYFGGDFANEVVADQFQSPHHSIAGTKHAIPLTLIRTAQPHPELLHLPRHLIGHLAILHGVKLRDISDNPVVPARKPRQGIQRIRQQGQDIPLIQIDIVREQLHLILVQDPIQGQDPRIRGVQFVEGDFPLQDARLDLLLDPAGLPIGRRTRRRSPRGTIRVIDVELSDVVALGGLGHVHRHDHDDGDDDDEGDAGVHAETAVLVQGGLGVRVVLDGGVDVVVFGGGVDGEGHGQAVFGEARGGGGDVGVGAGDGGGDAFVVEVAFGGGGDGGDDVFDVGFFVLDGDRDGREGGYFVVDFFSAGAAALFLALFASASSALAIGHGQRINFVDR